MIIFPVLLTFVSAAFAAPAYFDLRQNGSTNGQANVEDVQFLLFPSKEFLDLTVSMFARTSSPLSRLFGNKAVARAFMPTYIFDTERPAENHPNVIPNGPEIIKISEMEPIRPDSDMTTLAVDNLATQAVEEDKTIMKVDEGKEMLYLIGGGLEECGPDGHRNSEGVCVYTPMFS